MGDGSYTLQQKTKRPDIFAEHLPMSRIQDGLQRGQLMQGTLRASRHCWWEARVAVYGPKKQAISVLIKGRDAVNRAVEGDTVAIRLLPKSKWGAAARREEVEEPELRGRSEEEGARSAPDSEMAIVGAGEDDEARTVADAALRPLSEMEKPSDPAEEGKGEDTEAAMKKSELLVMLDTADAEGLQPMGEVVGIIKRNWRQYCGSLVVGRVF